MTHIVIGEDKLDGAQELAALIGVHHFLEDKLVAAVVLVLASDALRVTGSAYIIIAGISIVVYAMPTFDET